MVMILSVDVAMRVDAASSFSRGCLVWGWASVVETMRWPAGVRMVPVVGRSQELLQAAPGRRWNCGGLNISSVMILSVDAAMRMEAASSVSSAEGGCWVTARREMRSPCQAPSRSMGCGCQRPSFLTLARPVLQSPPLPPPPPLAVQVGLLMPALGMQAMLLVLWGLE